jgi:hypothetical protein
MRRFWRGLVMDPATHDASSSRCIALWFAVVCVPLALVKDCDAATVSALVVGGVVALLTRKKGEPAEEGA